VKLFRLHLIESGASISNRNRITTGVKFLLRVTLEPHDLTSEVYRIKELPSGSRGPVDISVRQQRHLAFIHRPRKNDLNGHNQCA
jgi:hypothetical protein